MKLNLTDNGLISHQAHINGVWVDADNGETLDVTNPATGEVISSVVKCGTAETRRMIEAAAVAQKSWSDHSQGASGTIAPVVYADYGKPRRSCSDFNC